LTQLNEALEATPKFELSVLPVASRSTYAGRNVAPSRPFRIVIYELKAMKVELTFPSSKRDLRLDLFRGLANWAMFLGHIPATVLAWLSFRNYGFSDGADLFVFISGYTSALVYARKMRERGFIFGCTKLFRRSGKSMSPTSCCSCFTWCLYISCRTGSLRQVSLINSTWHPC